MTIVITTVIIVVKDIIAWLERYMSNSCYTDKCLNSVSQKRDQYSWIVSIPWSIGVSHLIILSLHFGT